MSPKDELLKPGNSSGGSIPTLASMFCKLICNDLRRKEGQSFTGFFTCLAALAELGLCSVNARPLFAYCESADRFTLATCVKR
jgi:hypothetical protein